MPSPSPIRLELATELAVLYKAALASGNLTEAQRDFAEQIATDDVRFGVPLRELEQIASAVREAVDKGGDEGSVIREKLLGSWAGNRQPAMTVAPAFRREADEPDLAGLTVQAGEVVNYVLHDGALLQFQPNSIAELAFDGVVRTVTLQGGKLLVTRPPKAAGTMLVRIGGAEGASVRVDRNSAATIEIDGDRAYCMVGCGRCIITTDEDDVAVVAGQSAGFDTQDVNLFESDLDRDPDWVRDQLVGNGRCLSSVVDELLPYSCKAIEISPALAERTVDGEYRLSTTYETLKAIAGRVGAQLLDRPAAFRLVPTD